MTSSLFQLQPGETILYRSGPKRKWYAITWRIISSLLGITFFIFLLYILLSGPLEWVLRGFLPSPTASLLSQILLLGVVPLLVAAWIAEDSLSTFTCELVLTDRRLWVKASPYAWSQTEMPLGDIDSMTFRRDAIFLRQKSTRRMQVHMFPDGRLIVKAYEQFLGRGR